MRDDRFRGAGARHGVERNRHDGAQALRDDALRALQLDVGLLQVLGDDAGLAVDAPCAARSGWERNLPSAKPAPPARRASRCRSAPVGVGLEQKAAVGVGDGDGVIEHGFEHGVERKLRMQQHGRFEQQVELAESDGRRFHAGNAPHAGEEILNRDLRRGSVKHDLVGIFEAERDDVAFLQRPSGNSFAVDEHAELVPAILQKVLAVLGENRRAVARDPAVRDRQLVADVAASDQKRRLREGHGPASIFWRDQFDYGFAGDGSV